MTAPAQGWVQMPGGYDPNGQYQQQNGQPAGPPMPRGFQQAPQPQFNLPPQMGQPPMEQGWSPPPAAPAPQQQQVPQQQGQQPQGWQPPAPQGQFQQPPQQQGAPVDPNMRLSGPNVPPELQGRTLGEAVALYQGLRNVSLDLMRQQQAGQQPTPVQQPAQQPQVPQQGAPPADPNAWDWRNPNASIERTVTKVMQEQIMPMLAPMTADRNMGAIRSAMAQAAQEIGPQRWASIEASVIQNLQGADPQALMNPRTWGIAARAVLGDQMIRGQQAPQPQQQPNGPGAYPAQQVGQFQNPSPNLNTFFSEQPNQGGNATPGVNLTPLQDFARKAMGLDVQTYQAWMVGAQNAQAAGR